MASIQAKQDETDDELRQTLRRLEATEMKTAEAKERGTQERMLIKQDVDIIRNLLNEVRLENWYDYANYIVYVIQLKEEMKWKLCLLL